MSDSGRSEKPKLSFEENIQKDLADAEKRSRLHKWGARLNMGILAVALFFETKLLSEDGLDTIDSGLSYGYIGAAVGATACVLGGHSASKYWAESARINRSSLDKIAEIETISQERQHKGPQLSSAEEI